jgi:phosphate:Na+ symporter
LALAGFGLFFVGVDVLKNAFEALATTIDLQKFQAEGIGGILLFLFLGFLMTVLTQSSSAAIAITLTAVTGGVIGIYAAAAMVIGANVGTTSTAIFSVIGATPNAKRVAAAHVVFNVTTGIVALLTLPLLFYIIKTTGKILRLENIPAVTLALFHTTFNILGVLLMWPASNTLARYLETKFTSMEEIEGRPQYLDKNIAESPTLALNALAMELTHVSRIARRVTKAVMSLEHWTGKQIKMDLSIIKQLITSIGDFVARLERSSMPVEVSERLPLVLRTAQHYLVSAELSVEFASLQHSIGEIKDEEINQQVARFRANVAELLDASDTEAEDFSLEECDECLKKLKSTYDDLKKLILEKGAHSKLTITIMSAIWEQMNIAERLAKQMIKATHYLSDMFAYNSKPDKVTESA